MAHVSFTIQIQYTGSYFPNSSIRCNLLITLLVQLELIWGSGFKTPKLRRRIWHWQNPCSELALSSVGSQISESERFAVIGLRQTCDTSVLMHNLQNSASVVGKAFFFCYCKVFIYIWGLNALPDNTSRNHLDSVHRPSLKCLEPSTASAEPTVSLPAKTESDLPTKS